MTAAAVTLTKWIDTADPNVECVIVTAAADADWYVSRKFSAVSHVQISGYAYSAAAADSFSVASVSGGTITLKLVAAATTGTFALTIRGRP